MGFKRKAQRTRLPCLAANGPDPRQRHLDQHLAALAQLVLRGQDQIDLAPTKLFAQNPRVGRQQLDLDAREFLVKPAQNLGHHRINDVMGHAQGDAALKLLGRQARQQLIIHL